MTKRPLEFTSRLRTIYELLHCDIAVYVFNLTASKNFQSFCCGDIDCVRNTAAHHLMTVSLGIVNVFCCILQLTRRPVHTVTTINTANGSVPAAEQSRD